MRKFYDGHVMGCYMWCHVPTLGEVVRELWGGSNKDIRAGLYRVKRDGLVKDWPVVTDPSYRLEDCAQVARGKGTGMDGIKRIRYELGS